MTSLYRRVVMLIGLLLAAGAVAQEGAPGLRDQVRALASANRFEIVDPGRIADEPAKRVSGGVDDRLRELLEEYNYITYHGGADGALEKVVITGRKARVARAVRSFTVKTTRLGAHHFVDAVIIGAVAVPVPVSMMVDTGASTVVLPASMIEALGFSTRDLSEKSVETVAGAVVAKLARLDAVQVGGATVEDVAVTFIPAAYLGDQKLLGMSFLDSFKVTIDDVNDEIVLDRY